MTKSRTPHRDNVDGPFYVENECCISCDIPRTTAPELFKYDEGRLAERVREKYPVPDAIRICSIWEMITAGIAMMLPVVVIFYEEKNIGFTRINIYLMAFSLAFGLLNINAALALILHSRAAKYIVVTCAIVKSMFPLPILGIVFTIPTIYMLFVKKESRLFYAELKELRKEGANS